MEADMLKAQSKIRQHHIGKDPGVTASSELFALACRPTPTPTLVNSCVVNGVRFVVHRCNEHRTTQNNDICSPGDKDEEMYYGQLEKILEFLYMSFKVVLFRVKWFDTINEGRKVKSFVIKNNMTQIWVNGESFKDDQYILTTQVKQVFYLEDMSRRPPNWKVVEDVNHRKFLNEGVIVVEDDHDVIHFDISSDLVLFTSLNDLDFATLHIDGQSIDVDAPPDIIDVYEDDDIIDDEDTLPHDLADSNDEYLINVVDDDVVVVILVKKKIDLELCMSADVVRGQDGDGGGDDRPPPHQLGDGHPKTQPRRQESRQAEYPQGNQELRLKEDHESIWPIGDPEFSVHFYSWRNILEERKAGVMGNIRTQFDLMLHVQSDLWPKIKKGIEQHLAKIYTDNNSSLKAEHWVVNPDDET
nr:hypothetical protein [Tanacetum cinerariifolium]